MTDSAENPGLLPEGVFDQVTGELIDNSFIGEMVLGVMEDDPDAVEALMMQWDKNMVDYYTEDGKIDRTALMRSLTSMEKIKILMGDWFENFFSEKIDEKFDDVEIETTTFEKFAAAAEGDTGPVYMDGRNVIYPSGSLLEIFGSGFAFLERMREGKKEGIGKAMLPVESRVVWPRKEVWNSTKFSFYRKLLDKAGVELTLLSPGEKAKKPKKNELQIIYGPKHELPLAADGKTVDKKQIEWFKDIFEDKVGTTWYLSSKLIAGIYKAQGMTRDEALEEAGVQYADKDLIAQIDSIAGPVAAVAPVAPAVAGEAPAEGEDAVAEAEAGEEPEEEAEEVEEEEEVDEVAAEWAALVDDGPYKSGSVEFNYETSEGVLPVAFDIDEMTINVGENKAKIVASGATLKSVMPREDGNVKLTFSKWGFSKSKEVSSEKLREFVDKIAVGQPKEIALGEGAKLEMIA